MTFQNSILAGLTLIREAIQSQDFQSGVQGWAIRADGSAEFSDIVIRGGGTADPVVIGPAGLPQVVIRTTPTNGVIVFPTNRPIELDAATLNSAVVDGGAADERSELEMTGPTVTGATDGVRVVLRSQPQDGSLPAEFSVQNRDGSETYFVVDDTEVRVVDRRIDSRQVAATDPILTGYIGADAFDRVVILASGEINWGSGAGARDVRLYREAASVLATDDNIRVYRAATTENALSVRLTGDTTSRLFINGDGSLNWGPGGGAGSDARLRRSGAGALDTTGSLAVGGALTAANIQSGTVTINPTVANEWTANAVIAFPTPFATAPALMLTCTAGGPASGTTTELEMCATGVSTTGFNARVRRGNTGSTTLTWLAIST